MYGWKRGAGDPTQLQKLTTAIEVAGAWCILKGRTFFTPKAEAVLAVDKRPPVLYLRSFRDEKPDSVKLEGMGLYIDRSLEMKLAKYFRPFGPFVAIGSQQDSQPKLGAIRLMRSDDEWQIEIKNLMSRSANIVTAVGISQWIKWEINEIVTRNYVNKTIFMFPVTIYQGWRLKRKRKAEQDLRLKIFREALGTNLADQLKDGEFALSCVVMDNNVCVVVSKVPSSNAQVLALIVGHCLHAKYINSRLSQNSEDGHRARLRQSQL